MTKKIFNQGPFGLLNYTIPSKYCNLGLSFGKPAYCGDLASVYHLNYPFIFKRFYRKSPKFNLKLTSNLHEIICGNILGDLHAERLNIKHNTRLQFKYSIINEKYIFHLYDLFKEYTNGKNPFLLSHFDPRPDRNKTYSSLKFQTLSLPCFNVYREVFYNEEGRKIIPFNISDYLTEISLAYWFMDDGYKFNKGIYFCTESYTLQENNLLVEVLNLKFSLDCSVHKTTNGYRIYVKSNSMQKFIKLTSSYLLPLFHYKLGITTDNVKDNSLVTLEKEL